jgi:hypothetical protein
VRGDGEQLRRLVESHGEGWLRVTLPLEEGAEAHRSLTSGGTQGKLVL